jgi:Sec-independent protein translocase protein TatA
MAPGAFSPAHILIVLTVALIVLGPKELPKVVRAGAKAMRELRALRARLDEELHALIDDEDDDVQPPDFEHHAGEPPSIMQPGPEA